MRVNLDRKLQFPTEITTTSLRPDIVVWSTEARVGILIELTVPMEEGIEAAFERKRGKYLELAAECLEVDWKISIYPVEVGFRGCMGLSTTRLLRDVGLTGGRLRKATKALAEEAEKGVFGSVSAGRTRRGGRTPNPRPISCMG